MEHKASAWKKMFYLALVAGSGLAWAQSAGHQYSTRTSAAYGYEGMVTPFEASQGIPTDRTVYFVRSCESLRPTSSVYFLVHLEGPHIVVLDAQAKTHACTINVSNMKFDCASADFKTQIVTKGETQPIVKGGMIWKLAQDFTAIDHCAPQETIDNVSADDFVRMVKGRYR